MPKTTRQRCKATTRKGTRCKQFARDEGLGYCKKHLLTPKFGKYNESGKMATKKYEYHVDPSNSSAAKKLNNLLLKFHLVASQLKQRHQGRGTIEIIDMNDIIDLLHALLKIDFKSIEVKQYKPIRRKLLRSLILLPENETAIAITTTKNLTEEQIQNLTDDIGSFKEASFCKILYYFIYDPDKKIKGPRRFQAELSKKFENLTVRAIVSS